MIASPSVAWTAGNGPARARMRGKTLVPCSGKCTVTKIEAWRPAGNPRTICWSASIPPAEAPITMMSRLLMRLPAEVGRPTDARSKLLGQARKTRADRQFESKGASAAKLAPYGESASHCVRHFAADRETQPRATHTRVFSELHERLEHHVELVAGNSWTGVAHLHECPVLADLGSEANGTARLRELDGVPQQVEKDLPNPLGIGANDRLNVFRRVVQRDAAGRSLRRDEVRDTPKDISERDVIHLKRQLAGGHLAEAQQVIHQLCEVLIRTLNTVDVRELHGAQRAANSQGQQLGVSADRAQ